jgi:hypothetical protein
MGATPDVCRSNATRSKGGRPSSVAAGLARRACCAAMKACSVLGGLGLLSGQRELASLAVEQSRLARVDSGRSCERGGGRGRLVQQGLHQRLVGVGVGAPRIQAGGFAELALSGVEPVAVEVHDAQRQVDLGGAIARADCCLELLDRSVPRRERGAHRLQRVFDAWPLVSERAGESHDELADPRDELLLLAADLRDCRERVLDTQLAGSALAAAGGLAGGRGSRPNTGQKPGHQASRDRQAGCA